MFGGQVKLRGRGLVRDQVGEQLVARLRIDSQRQEGLLVEVGMVVLRREFFRKERSGGQGFGFFDWTRGDFCAFCFQRFGCLIGQNVKFRGVVRFFVVVQAGRWVRQVCFFRVYFGGGFVAAGRSLYVLFEVSVVFRQGFGGDGSICFEGELGGCLI